MIRVEFPWLVFLCLLVFLSGIFGVWICYEIVRRFQARRSLRGRVRCAVCSMEFRPPTTEELPVCPHCGSKNERQRPRIF